MMRQPEEYVCSGCSVALRSKPTARDEASIIEGALECPSCPRTYPIRLGIPRFVPMDNYAASFGLQWNTHARTQLDSYTGITISRDRLFDTTGWPEDLRGQRILEAGCGAGRFTEVLLQTGADVYSFDYSDAVNANGSNNGSRPNLHLFQADILDIPLRPRSFDKVICLGVLQHTPDPKRAFESLTKFVSPGGELVIDIYRGGIVALMQWKYVLRPITTKINQAALYRFFRRAVPPLVGPTRKLRQVFGRVGARLSPVVEYSDLGLPDDINREWAVLDAFDMYAPTHDHPQTLKTVQRWFAESAFEDVVVARGPNGIIARGRRPRWQRRLNSNEEKGVDEQ